MASPSVVTPRPLRAARARWLLAALWVGTALVGCKEDTKGPPPPQPVPGASSPSTQTRL